MSQKKNIRIKDIAEKAGVSVATVSNVLSGKRQKHSETGKRVLELAEELGYITSSTMRAKPSVRFVVYKKSGLVVMDTPFFSELFSGIERACASRGYTLTFSFIDSALFRLLGTTTAALCLHYLLAPLLKAAVFVGLYALWDKIRLLHRRLP